MYYIVERHLQGEIRLQIKPVSFTYKELIETHKQLINSYDYVNGIASQELISSVQKLLGLIND